jgi:DNA-binding transcriptional regulator LsrR (DeoR family)
MKKSFEFLVAVAKNYYINGMSQSEIAEKYKISRPLVAGILKECKEKGIVEIRINDTSPYSGPVSEELKSRFGLETACVIPNEVDYPLTLSKTCLQAALFFAGLLTDGIRIGVSWGTALYHMVRQVSPTAVEGSEVIQLMGGLGASAMFYDGSEIAHTLSLKIKARCYPFLAPLLVNSEELRNGLFLERGISETYEKTKVLDIALVGLSSDNPDHSALVQAGFLSADEARRIYEDGSCGHLCGYHYDLHGRFMEIPINRRVVGIDPAHFLHIKRRIGIACGERKAKALRAALSGRLITDLFTDELTALKISSE